MRVITFLSFNLICYFSQVIFDLATSSNTAHNLLLDTTLPRLVPTQSRTLRALLCGVANHVSSRCSHVSIHPIWLSILGSTELTLGGISQALSNARHGISKAFACARHNVAGCVGDAGNAFTDSVGGGACDITCGC